MKNKKLQKIIHKSLLKFKKKIDKLELKNNSEFVPFPLNQKNLFNNYMFSEPTEEICQKSRNLFFGLLKLRDQLSIRLDDDHIDIQSENGFSKNSKNYLTEYFHADIIKGTGYILTFKDKRFAFKDEKIYDDLIERFEETFLDLNINNFSDVYEEIMVDSGLAREANLTSLFS